MNRKIKSLIVDDEPLARKGLARYAGRIDSLELIGECEDVSYTQLTLPTTSRL
ncbi:MAG: hypothetical protein K2F76_08250 [Duncaniella dubosii]|nr:hypothetical protein [Duncaniella dubosii]